MENFEALSRIRDMARSSEPSRTVRASGGFSPRKAKPAPKTGGICPDCRMMKSVTGVCEC